MEADRVGVVCPVENLNAADAAAMIRKAEKLGYGSFWIGELVVGRDPFAMASFLLSQTSRIKVGLSVAIIWKRQPATMMNAARTLAGLFDNRFVLTMGASHKPFINRYGMNYEKPYRYMCEYVEKMKSAPFLGPKLEQEPPVLLAALMPKMLRLAAETDGAIITNGTPELTARVRAQLGPKKKLYVIMKMLLETDAAKAREAGRSMFRFYMRLPNYANSVRSLGFTEEDLAAGVSDRLVDALLSWGTEEHLRERLDEQFKAGADHVCILPLAVGAAAAGVPLLDQHTFEALAPR
ncbi:MAG TPA: TIGR03620 family F420-dependent LLM class oxidoreductase [Candidatus Binataceae bacterium]|jgi:probable F420-dependent oxidoreductase|nr:TIGR03620 family F420-dependent LLM class oxidoreductase [Candidatus Binataceae bacterium]